MGEGATNSLDRIRAALDFLEQQQVVSEDGAVAGNDVPVLHGGEGVEKLVAQVAEQSARIQELEAALGEARKTQDEMMVDLKEALATEKRALEQEAKLKAERDALSIRCEELEAQLVASQQDMEEAEAVLEAVEEPVVMETNREGRCRFGDMLVEAGIISQEECAALLTVQEREKTTRLGELAVQQGFANETDIAHLLASQLKLDFVDLTEAEPATAVVDRISPHLARLHQVLPMREDEGGVVAAMSNPLDLIALEDLELALNKPVAPMVATSSLVRERVEKLYPASFDR